MDVKEYLKREGISGVDEGEHITESVLMRLMEGYYKAKTQENNKVSKEHLTRIVWDGFLTAEYQDEHWHDEDTCNLIVRKILNNEEIEYATGKLP